MSIQPIALTVAGSDPSGGAGLQADLKTFQSIGVHGMSAVTVATDCGAHGVERVHAVAPVFVARQIRRLCRDLRPDAVKTGMLFDRNNVAVVARHLAAAPALPYVFDPVITTRRGERLVNPATVSTMQERLLPRCALVTPSLPEASLLTGITVATRETMERAAEHLLQRGTSAVLITGGHLEERASPDLYMDARGVTRWFEAPRHPQTFHGAGDCLSAAITARLAQGARIEHAVEGGERFIRQTTSRASAAAASENNAVYTVMGLNQVQSGPP